MVEKEDALQLAAEKILSGEVLALKGTGGYHLACLADDKAAVQKLRERKKRKGKPLAVMFASLQEAQKYAYISEA